MLDQQAETVRGDHMSLLRGGGGVGGKGRMDFPLNRPSMQIDVNQRDAKSLSGAAKSRGRGERRAAPGEAAHR